jgi:diguanylate cyclase (GGDEF)-like protein
MPVADTAEDTRGLRATSAVPGVLTLANGMDLEDQLAELRAIHRSLRALISTLDLPEILRAVLDSIKEFTAAEGLSLLLHDPDRDELVFAATETLRENAVLEPSLIEGERLRSGQGIAGWVARHREAVRLDDASQDPRHYAALAERTGLTPRSMLCVPVMHRDRILGVIEVINKLNGPPFTDEELRLVQTLADHAAIAIANASAYREARAAAVTDDLTGLGNTRRFNTVLPELMACGGPLSLLMLDLDNFKALVDSRGHLIGSRTIGFVGRIIAGALRPADVAARFGGDEFVVILPRTDTAAAARIAETIRAAIAAASILDGTDVDISGVTASVGVATFPDHAPDAEALFRAADAAMYAVKRDGKNAVALAAAHVRPTGAMTRGEDGT